MAAAPPSGIEGVGSNNWVVSGSHTTTGTPLLANDPHLKLTVPALWHFARLEAPGFKVAGATMPGLPLVVLGQNEHIAWGFTNTGPDVQDVYIERVHPADANLVQTPDGWAPLKTYTEVIKVRGKPDVTMTVRESRHGPVISDAGLVDDLLGNKSRTAYAFAMRWTALDPDIDSVGVALALQPRHRRGVVHRGGQGLGGADAEHGGGRQVPAASAGSRRAACRCARPSNDLKGYVPAPGWDARYDWAGWLGADALPHRARSRARLDRHRQPARGRGRLSALPDQRVGAAVPSAAHRAAAECQAQTLDRRPRGDAGRREVAGGARDAAVAAARPSPTIRWRPTRARRSRASTARWPPSAPRR